MNGNSEYRNAMGHLVAMGDPNLTDSSANLWAHWQDCLGRLERDAEMCNG